MVLQQAKNAAFFLEEETDREETVAEDQSLDLDLNRVLDLALSVQLVTVDSGLLEDRFVIVVLVEALEVFERDDVLVFDPAIDGVQAFAAAVVPRFVARLKDDAHCALFAGACVPLNVDFLIEALQVLPQCRIVFIVPLLLVGVESRRAAWQSPFAVRLTAEVRFNLSCFRYSAVVFSRVQQQAQSTVRVVSEKLRLIGV